jgi:two-component system, NarL family, response regulator DevR
VKEEEASAFVNLSQQEKHVLMLVSEGKTNREIAKRFVLRRGNRSELCQQHFVKIGC